MEPHLPRRVVRAGRGRGRDAPVGPPPPRPGPPDDTHALCPGRPQGRPGLWCCRSGASTFHREARRYGSREVGRGGGRHGRVRGARAGAPARPGPLRRPDRDAPAGRRGGHRLRRAGPHVLAASAARRADGRPRGLRRRRRLRPAAAPPRRPDGRGDLDQRAGPGVRRPARPLGADHHDPERRPGARPRRENAQVVRATGRPEQPVRGRDAPRRLPAARGRPRHHAQALVGEHPQVRPHGQLPRRAGRPRDADPAGRPVPRGSGRGRAQRHRRRAAPRPGRPPFSTASRQRSPARSA